jgi:NAD(P)-dependent dehydrogenase (short-subunit alcohol dehydrogenase family)
MNLAGQERIESGQGAAEARLFANEGAKVVIGDIRVKVF